MTKNELYIISKFHNFVKITRVSEKYTKKKNVIL